MSKQLAEKIVAFFGTTIPGELTIFIVSLFPILELRGGLIASALLNIPLWKAFLICYIANIIPIPFIVFFIKQIFKWLYKYKFFAKIIDKLERKTEKNKDKIMKYEEWGLLIFVAIPLPGTGGWTGALFAALLNLNTKKSILIICLGVLIAGFIMALITYFIPGFISGRSFAEIITSVPNLA